MYECLRGTHNLLAGKILSIHKADFVQLCLCFILSHACLNACLSRKRSHRIPSKKSKSINQKNLATYSKIKYIIYIVLVIKNALIKIIIYFILFFFERLSFMEMSPAEKEWIRLVSKEIVRQTISGVLAAHIRSCPHGQKQYGFKQLLLGIGIGAGIFGSGFGIANLIARIASAL
jgi:hypothetical protein